MQDAVKKERGLQPRQQASVVVISALLLSMGYIYSSESEEHGFEIESCSRPVLGLLGCLWGLAAVAYFSHQQGIDMPKVFGSPIRNPNFVYDCSILASSFSVLYLACSVIFQTSLDLGDAAFAWKYFSLGAFFTGCLLLLSPSNIIPLRPFRSAVSLSLARTVMAGCFPVCFADVMTGDFLTSLSKSLGDLLICPCGWGGEESQMSCITSMTTPVIVALPFLWRFLQCIRCYTDSRAKKHLLNAFKYSLGICVVFLSTFRRRGDVSPYVPHAYYLFVAFNSLYSFGWDVAMDWGLWEIHPGKGLVNRLKKYPERVYVIAAVLDFTLRISWSLKMINPSFSGERSVAASMVAELFRRTIWACLRIEFEEYKNSLTLSSRLKTQNGEEQELQRLKAPSSIKGN